MPGEALALTPVPVKTLRFSGATALGDGALVIEIAALVVVAFDGTISKAESFEGLSSHHEFFRFEADRDQRSRLAALIGYRIVGTRPRRRRQRVAHALA